MNRGNTAHEQRHKNKNSTPARAQGVGHVGGCRDGGAGGGER